MQSNQSKTAIVTGSSRGIGAAIAKRLAADGFSVVVNYAGRAADAGKVVEEIQTAKGQAIAVQADVSVAADVATLFEKAEESFGGVDVIINNAGIMQPSLVPLVDTDDALFDRLLGTLRIPSRRFIERWSSGSTGSTPPRSTGSGIPKRSWLAH